MQKRGLSTLVTTVLVVLVVLVAVGVIWFFLRPTFVSSSEQVSLQEKCWETDAKPVICAYTNISSADYYTRVLIKNVRGEEPVNVVVALEHEDGSVETKAVKLGNVLGVSRAQIASTKKPTKVVVTPIVFNEQNTKNVTCSYFNEAPCEVETAKGNLCDDLTLSEDVVAFVKAIDSFSAQDGQYEQQYPNCDIFNADFNCNGINNVTGDRWGNDGELIVASWDVNLFLATLKNWPLCNRSSVCTDHGSGNCWANSVWCDTNCKLPTG